MSRPSASRAAISASAPKLRAKPESLVDRLRHDILRGGLEPGLPLRQDEIAARCGVSKIPVREALLQLVAEGLVVLQPNRGFTVAGLQPQEAEEILVHDVLDILLLEAATREYFGEALEISNGFQVSRRLLETERTVQVAADATVK